MNAATIQAVMETGSGQIPLHYYTDDSIIAGDYWAGENEDISSMLDKMIANLKEGINKIENFDINVIYTPGHKDDSITFYFEEEKVMFCGDFIFKDGIGRIDLEDASPLDMKLSIEKILQYPDDITLCPGHGPMTTLGAEKENLKYFKVAI